MGENCRNSSEGCDESRRVESTRVERKDSIVSETTFIWFEAKYNAITI